MLTFVVNINADTNTDYDTCTYTYNGCDVTFRLADIANGTTSELEKKWILDFPTGRDGKSPHDLPYCNASDKVQSIGYGPNDNTVKSNLENNFTRVKNNLADNQCPELRVSKKPVENCLINPSANRVNNSDRFTCYRLGQRAFETGKCTSTSNYACLTNGEFHANVPPG